MLLSIGSFGVNVVAWSWQLKSNNNRKNSNLLICIIYSKILLNIEGFFFILDKNLKKNRFMKNIIILIFLLFSIQSCDTEDILPAVMVELEDQTISENNGSITITATLNGAVSNDINISLQFSGSAVINSDYSVSSDNILINNGSTTGSVTISAIQDNEIENPEEIIIDLVANSNFLLTNNSQLLLTLLDDDTDTDGDGTPDSEDLCPEVAGLQEFNGCPCNPLAGFIINEVLYDPPAGDNIGDANGDGARDANEDEFIEFYNSGLEIDISGYTITDNRPADGEQLRHTFPTGSIIPANGVLVLFGGGNPSGDFGNSVVQTASEGMLNMNNTGDLVTMYDTCGDVILTFDVEPLSNNPNESYTRSPDITGETFEQHAGIASSNGALFSPGYKLDGTDF